MVTNKHVLSWIEEMAALTCPDKIVWIDGSEEQAEALRAEACSTGEMIKLNEEKLPGCYLHHTAVNDVARVEGRTFICTSKKEDAGTINNWMDPKECYEKLGKLYKGAMKGRTMYVIPYSMGIVGSDFAKYGIELTDSAGKSGFITGLYMILVPIIGIFIGKKTNILSWIGAVFGVVGLGLICLDGGALTITAGDAVLMLSAIVFAIHIMVIDHFGDNIYSLRFSMTQFAVCTVINWILALFTEDISSAAILSAGIPIAYCGFMSVGVAYTCQVIGLKYSDPTSGSIILSTESVFAAIGGAIILHERMAPLAYLGCALIFAGIILAPLKFKEL